MDGSREVRPRPATSRVAGEPPTVGEEIGEGVGGISGTLAGAAIGSLAGPIGVLVGGVAGAVGGWWAGRAIADSMRQLARDDTTDAFHRELDDSLETLADRGYEDMRPAYYLGHLASRHPEHEGRRFEDVEPEVERGWRAGTRDAAPGHEARPLAREGLHHGVLTTDEGRRLGLEAHGDSR
jgi:hypothetical protein